MSMEDSLKNKITLALFVLLLFSSLLGYIKLPYINYGISNVTIPLFAIIMLSINLDRFKEAIKYHRRTLIFLSFLYIWMWISAYLSEFREISIKYSIKYSIYFILLASFLIVFYKRKDKDSYHLWLFRLLIVLAGFGVVEYFFPKFWLFSIIRSPESLAHYPRISSLMQGPNQFGVLMAIAVSFGTILYKNRVISFAEFMFGLLLFITTNAFSGSRNGWMIFLLGLFLLWVLRLIRIRTILLILLLWLSVIFAPFIIAKVETLKPPTPANQFLNPTNTLHHRIALWKAALNEIPKRPITGLGIEVFEKKIGFKVLGQEGYYHTHNLILNILVELGIVGLALFSLLIYSLLRGVRCVPVLFIPLILILLAQIFDFFLHDPAFALVAIYFLAQVGNLNGKDY